MQVEIDIPGADAKGQIFLTWAPVQAQARLVDGPGGGVPVDVTLQNAGSGGQLVFDDARTDLDSGTLALSLPADGTAVDFWIAGEFQQPSLAYGDAVVEAVPSGGTDVLGSKAVMVRVRKNAETLTAAERDRFLTAFATLNGSGAGGFRDFRDMHLDSTSAEAHGNVGFLPWHRAYLLDLERELQAIDPSVALPYWRFDLPAPKLFTRQFIGLPNSVDRVQFTAGHPLGSWQTDGFLGITRHMEFAASAAPAGLLTESQTIALGSDYGAFSIMEGNPHGFAHTSFGGFISDIDTAAKDPLFFMLHANVDRLWAKWQWLNGRTNPADPAAFASANRVGHRLNDTMWPWNGVTGPPRPSTAPGGGLASSIVTSAPGSSPRVSSMLDFQGVVSGTVLGFAYDDVPFEL
jgi:tyrosinase